MKADHKSEYSRLFTRLGFPVSKKDGIPAAQLTKAVNKLGIQLPIALRDYYLVAGKEKIFNHSFNRLCSPSDWEVHAGKLIFFEENQTVVVWGVPASKEAASDPVVFQCPLVSGELDKWYSEKIRCSAFLKFMIHLQAAYGGGMPFTASAPVANEPSMMPKSDWESGGEVNGMQTYSMQDRVVCVTKWQDFGSDRRTWRVFGGATSRDKLDTIAADLGINWDS
jgi:hypothetical protein